MKKRYSGPQIVAKLREADILLGKGKTVPEVCKDIEISQQTYYPLASKVRRYESRYGKAVAGCSKRECSTTKASG